MRVRVPFAAGAFVLLVSALLSPSQTAAQEQSLPPSPLIAAVDCDSQATGLQFYCSPAGGTYEAPIILQNITGSPVRVASFSLEIGIIDALALVDSPRDTLDSNPDFNDADFGRAWSCQSTPDVNPDPGLFRTTIACQSTGSPLTLAPGVAAELARARYTVVARRDAPVFLEHVAVRDAEGLEIGSCYPAANQVRQRDMRCYDAIALFDAQAHAGEIALQAVRGVEGGAAPLAIDVVQSSSGSTTIIQVDLHFDRSLVELIDIIPSDVYDDAVFAAGVTGQSEVDAITDANHTGTLRDVTLAHDRLTVPPGRHTVFRAVFAARRSGVSPVVITGMELLDASFRQLEVIAPESSLSTGLLVPTSQLIAPTATAIMQVSSPPVGIVGSALPPEASPPETDLHEGPWHEDWRARILMIAALNLITGLLILARGFIIRPDGQEWA